MALSLTPEDLMNEYYKLAVPLDDGPPVTVTIDHYKNNGIMKGSFSTQAAKTEALHPIQTALKKDPSRGSIDGKPVDPYVLRLTFAGKGLPDDIRATLRLAVRYGMKGNLQEYCDKYIGLDCNGFVGNYLLLRGQKHFGTNRSEGGKGIDDIGIDEINRPTYRRKSASEILANDVLVWPGLHIAIINQVFQTGPTVEFTVVESNSVAYKDKKNGGLYMSRYQLLKPFDVPKGQRMNVKRGVGDEMPVYIVDVELAWPQDKAIAAAKRVANKAAVAAGVAPIVGRVVRAAGKP